MERRVLPLIGVDGVRSAPRTHRLPNQKLGPFLLVLAELHTHRADRLD